MFNKQLHGAGGDVTGELCSVAFDSFYGLSTPNHDLFQATNMTSLNMELERDAQ